ncbi:MAG: potassium transporter, partial [Planctomycetes bacterium]|nr:potassium transporter [Planctomycetota bacterium]
VCTVIMCVPPHEIPIDLKTAGAASLSALNSIGPGLGDVGPVKNYAFVHPLGKLVLAFCMLLGRLEIYSLLILLLPTFWQRR